MIRVAVVVVLLISCLPCIPPAAAQNEAVPELREQPVETSPVEIDGTVLFSVRGIRSYPAALRAGLISDRIRAIAADRATPADAITSSESAAGTQIAVEGKQIMTVFDVDAALEGVARPFVAKVYVEKIRNAVEGYRSQRTAGFLPTRTFYAALATLLAFALAYLIQKLRRRLFAVLDSRYKERIGSLHIQQLEILHVERLRTALYKLLGVVRAVLVVVLIYFYLEQVLRLFPQTRFLSNHLSDYVMNPLKIIANGFIAQIPNLFFLAIAVLLTRYLLKVIHLFFVGIQNRQVTIAGFDPEWAEPTYRLVRILAIALVLVVMYPYIPGADTAAFKGITVFIGILFSLGSSSAISSVVAGYTMTYRKAFRVGDRVKIGDDTGDVTQMRLLVTHLKTVKNEEIIVPNSMVLNNRVVNYSSLAREHGLILHTSVTIGYDAPWRQVHAMLLRAADRTEGILKDPEPFVLQKSLDDFYVNYELNVYTDKPGKMIPIYSKLHENIQDQFNEYGVQIMSPHYEEDPKGAKVVPKELWYAAPAKPSSEETGG